MSAGRKTRPPRLRAPHPLSTIAGAHAFLRERGFTQDEYRKLRAISSASRDGDPLCSRFPDARERERLREETHRLWKRLVEAFGESPRALLRHEDMTAIGKGLSVAVRVLGEPETSLEKHLRRLAEDRSKGGASWWATLVLLRVAEQLGRRLEPIELHALAVASECAPERVDAARDLSDWRARHARCLQFAVRCAEARPAPVRERLLSILSPKRNRRRLAAAPRRRSA